MRQGESERCTVQGSGKQEKGGEERMAEQE